MAKAPCNMATDAPDFASDVADAPDVAAETLDDFRWIEAAAAEYDALSHPERVLRARDIGACAKEILRRLNELTEGNYEVYGLDGDPEDFFAILCLKARFVIYSACQRFVFSNPCCSQ